MMKPIPASLQRLHHLKYFDRFIGYRTRQVKVKVIIKNKFPGRVLQTWWLGDKIIMKITECPGWARLRYVINHWAGLVTPATLSHHHQTMEHSTLLSPLGLICSNLSYMSYGFTSQCWPTWTQFQLLVSCLVYFLQCCTRVVWVCCLAVTVVQTQWFICKTMILSLSYWFWLVTM